MSSAHALEKISGLPGSYQVGSGELMTIDRSPGLTGVGLDPPDEPPDEEVVTLPAAPHPLQYQVCPDHPLIRSRIASSTE